jgi:hypothetical protein
LGLEGNGHVEENVEVRQIPDSFHLFLRRAGFHSTSLLQVVDSEDEGLAEIGDFSSQCIGDGDPITFRHIFEGDWGELLLRTEGANGNGTLP